MSDNWYYAKRLERFGPVSFDRLKWLADRGWISRSDLVLGPGTSGWQKAHAVDGVFRLSPLCLAASSAMRSSPVRSAAEAWRSWTAFCRRLQAARVPMPRIRVVAPSWLPPIAAGVLSVAVPGLGQAYQWGAAVGLSWFLMVLFGYALFLLPGILLHVACVIAAVTNHPRKPMERYGQTKVG